MEDGLTRCDIGDAVADFAAIVTAFNPRDGLVHDAAPDEGVSLPTMLCLDVGACSEKERVDVGRDAADFAAKATNFEPRGGSERDTDLSDVVCLSTSRALCPIAGRTVASFDVGEATADVVASEGSLDLREEVLTEVLTTGGVRCPTARYLGAATEDHEARRKFVDTDDSVVAVNGTIAA